MYKNKYRYYMCYFFDSVENNKKKINIIIKLDINKIIYTQINFFLNKI